MNGVSVTKSTEYCILHPQSLNLHALSCPTVLTVTLNDLNAHARLFYSTAPTALAWILSEIFSLLSFPKYILYGHFLL